MWIARAVFRLNMLLVLTSALLGHAQTPLAGELDRNFGTNGVATIPSPPSFTWANQKAAMTPESNGFFYIAAIANHLSTGVHLIVTKVNTSGFVDATFGTNGYASFLLTSAPASSQQLRGIVLGPGGRLVVGINQPFQGRLVAFTLAGVLDSTFGVSGITNFPNVTLNGLTGSATSLTVFGSHSVENLGKEAWDRSLTSTGSITQVPWFPSINGPGDQEITCTGVMPNGTLLVVGHSVLPSGVRSVFVSQRYSRFQNVTLHFGTTAQTSIVVASDTPVIPKSFSLDALGEYVIHCERGTPGSNDLRAVAIRLRRTATVDLEFASETMLPLPFLVGGTNAEPLANGVTSLGSRQILLQTVKPGGIQSSFGLTRFFWNGALDTTFGSSGRAQTTFSSDVQAHQALITANSKILALGNTQPSTGTPSLFLTRFLGDPEPVNQSVALTENARNIEISNGETAALTLQAEGLPATLPLRYQLKKNGTRFGNSSLIPSFSFNFDPALENNYTIEVSNGLTTVESSTAKVYMRQPPQWFQPDTQKLNLIVGTPLFLNPQMSGRFPMTYTWRRTGGPILRQGSLQDRSWNDAPGFNPARMSDSGVYELRLANADGQSSVLRIEVTVLRDPIFVSQSESTLIVVGEMTSVWAQAAASTPTITYSCLKNGRPIPITDGVSSVDIQNATLADAGTYLFKAKSVKGVATSRPIELAVVDNSPGWRVAKPNGTVTFEAMTAGIGLSYAWFKDGQPLSESSKHRGTKTRQLTLHLASISDTGNYVCEVTGHGTTKQTGALTLHLVYEKPALTTTSLPPAQVGTVYQASLATIPLTSRFTATGLPKGLTLNPLTGRVSGIPRISGDYQVTINSTNPWGHTTQRLPLLVNALPSAIQGHFMGLSSTLNLPTSVTGQVNLQISHTGSYSGSFSFSKLKGRRQSIPIRGTLTNRTPGTNEWQMSGQTFKPLASTGYTSGYMIVSALEAGGTVDLDITMSSNPDDSDSIIVSCLQIPWHTNRNPVTTLIGQYNLESHTLKDETVMPSGYSFARVSVRSNGLVTISGLLCDNTPLVTSSWLTASRTVPIHSWLYGNKGFHRTTLSLIEGSQPDYWDNRVTGNIQWFKNPSITRKDSSYLDGFSVSPDWSGSRYLPPNSPGTGPFLMNAVSGENNLYATFQNTSETRHTFTTLTTKHQARSVDPGAEFSDRVVDLKFIAKTGQFTGTWIKNIWDESVPIPRWKSSRLPIKGLIVRFPQSLEGKGFGFIRVPTKKIETDSRGRPKVRSVFEPSSVLFSPIN